MFLMDPEVCSHPIYCSCGPYLQPCPKASCLLKWLPTCLPKICHDCDVLAMQALPLAEMLCLVTPGALRKQPHLAACKGLPQKLARGLLLLADTSKLCCVGRRFGNQAKNSHKAPRCKPFAAMPQHLCLLIAMYGCMRESYRASSSTR